MGQPILGDRIFQGARDVGLTDQIVKSLGPIFSGKNLVAHTLNLMRESNARKQKRIVKQALHLPSLQRQPEPLPYNVH